MISKELNEGGNIPSRCITDLQNRLAIAFKDPKRQKRGEQARPKSQILANTRQNHAYRVYINVLDRHCHMFLPFILGVSPRSCARVDLNNFFEFTKSTECTIAGLGLEAKATLEEIARSEGFIESLSFKKLIQAHFPEGT